MNQKKCTVFFDVLSGQTEFQKNISLYLPRQTGILYVYTIQLYSVIVKKKNNTHN